MNDQTHKFRELLKGFDTAVLITRGNEALFHARPMALAKVEENCDLWFITHEDSGKVREIEEDGRAQAICQKAWESCAIVSGHAELLRDRVKIREVWKPNYKPWFPQGEDDPQIVLIRLTGEQGEYWDSTGANGLRYAYETMEAVAQGTRPQIREGEQHGRVELAGKGSHR